MAKRDKKEVIDGLLETKTPAQRYVIDNLLKYRVVFATGPAGSGKTHLAMAVALHLVLKRGKNQRNIVLSRPAVTTDDEDLGFLPGTVDEKMAPFLRPLRVIFNKLKGNIEIPEPEVCPLAYMRGRTFDNSVVIIDECQNMTVAQMKMALTRVGLGSSIFICGDNDQSDLVEENALEYAKKYFRDLRSKGIALCELTEDDIVRDPVVRTVLERMQDVSDGTYEADDEERIGF